MTGERLLTCRYKRPVAGCGPQQKFRISFSRLNRERSWSAPKPVYTISISSRLARSRALISRLKPMACAVYRPLRRAFWLPTGAPLPLAPPCILHRRFPRTAGDRHGVPLRVRAPHRGAWFIGDSSWRMGLFLRFLGVPSPGVDRTDDRLSALVHVDVLDGHLLLAFTSMVIERLE